MRFTRLILAYLSLITSGLAATIGPAPPGVDARVKAHSAELQVRDNSCQTLASTIETIGTSNIAVIYGSFGGFDAKYICGRLGYANCQPVFIPVALAFITVFAATNRDGALAVSSRGEVRRAQHMSDVLHEYLGNNSISYDAITDLTGPLLPLYGKEDRRPVSVTSLHGVRFFNDTAVNMDLYDFGNGEGHIYLPHDMLEERSETDILNHRLAKRAKAPGFKLSFTTRVPTKLSKSHQADMTNALTSWWANTAGITDLHDMIGFLKTDHTANFYYRLIPENSDYGLNYESVDSCGQMAKYL